MLTPIFSSLSCSSLRSPMTFSSNLGRFLFMAASRRKAAWVFFSSFALRSISSLSCCVQRKIFVTVRLSNGSPSFRRMVRIPQNERKTCFCKIRLLLYIRHLVRGFPLRPCSRGAASRYKWQETCRKCEFWSK